MVEVLLVLEMFLAKILRLKICSVMTLPALKNPCSSAMVFFRLQLQSVQYDLQHDFVWVTDEFDHSVVLALLQVAFLVN